MALRITLPSTHRLVLLEISPQKDNVEIVHWHFLRDEALETLKRQAAREGGHILILPSEEEDGGLSARTLGMSSEGKDTKESEEKQEKVEKSSSKQNYLTSHPLTEEQNNDDTGRRYDEDIEDGYLSVEEGKARMDELSKKYHAAAPIEVVNKYGDDRKLAEVFHGDAIYIAKIAHLKDRIKELADIVRQGLKNFKSCYLPTLKKIVIFADELDADLYEEAFFHENIHAILDQKYGDGVRDIVEHFWNNAPQNVNGITREDVQKDGKYSDEEMPEEFFTHCLAHCMATGHITTFESYLDNAPDKEIYDNILKEIGYDIQRERRERILGGKGKDRRRYSESEEERISDRQERVSDSKQRIAQHIDSLVKKLGTKAKTTVYHSLGELPSDVRRHIEDAHKRGRKVRGWYENGRVYLFLPDIDSTYQAEKTIWHETVAHHGLRQLIGDENLDRLLRHLWLEHKDGDMGTWVTKRMRENGWMLNNYRHNGKKIAGNLKRY